jgi:ribosome-binding protein aMBF1 (putative translation factor)
MVKLCGAPLRFYEWPGGPAVLDGLTCGKRAGHKSKRHRSAVAMEAARRKGVRQPASGSPEVAQAIREARKVAGLTQRRLAALAGVTEVCVQLWERAQRTPGAESWQQLELALGPLGVVRDRKPGSEEEEAAA